MIFLHMDKKYRPDQWYRRYEALFRERGLRYQKVDLRKLDYRKLHIEAGDALMGRFGHNLGERRRIQPIFADLNARFGGRTFPSLKLYDFYDDKRKQMDLFAAREYATPETAYVETREEAEAALASGRFQWPVVTKHIYGAGSENVALAHNLDELAVPGVMQEFCRDNPGDLRVVIIGHRVMGFLRGNRPGDFRASGSGLVEYPEELDGDAVRLCWKISEDNGFECMSYDLVRNNAGRWVVLEMSYAFVDALIRDCAYYYDMSAAGEKRSKGGVYPQDFILDDFLERYPEVGVAAR